MSRAPEFTYYDELGIPADASPEQIRDAFRALVRLLHPDQQTDAQLKDIAERQMRKLNGIYAVLSDIERRRRYNDSLEEDHRPPTLIFSPNRAVNLSSKFVSRLAWGVVAVVIVGALIALSWDSPAPLPAADRGSAAGAPTASAPASSDDTAQLRTDLRVARAERDLAIRELTRLRGGNYPAISGASAPAESTHPAAPTPSPAISTFTELPPNTLRIPPPAIAQPTPNRPVLKQFAGFWSYTRPALGQKNKNQSLYAPEFIELTLTEQNGAVQGKYRSRYRIVDRPISPDVNFEFHAPMTGPTLKGQWNGPGGARGDLTLKLTGENALSVEWTAAELGSMQALNSGTAKLTRRPE